MHRKIYILILVLFPLLSFSQVWKTFTDTAGKFTASYPSNWINKIKEGNRVFFTSPADSEPDNFYENINISVSEKEVFSGMTVKDLFPTITNSIKKEFTGYEEEGIRYFKWNNIDGAEFIYSGYNKNNESLKIRTTQWFCFYRSRLYVVTFVATADKNIYNETASKIMSSIVFK